MKKLALVLIILLLPVLQGSAKPYITIKDVVITPKYKPNGTILVDIQVTVWHEAGREGWIAVYKDGSIFEIAKKYFNATQAGEKTITLENINIGLGKTTIKVEANICSCSPSTEPYPYCSIVADCTWKVYTKVIDANTLIVPTTTIIERTTTLKTTETLTKFINYTVTQVVTETEINTVTNTVTETKTITQVIKEEVTPIWAYASLGSFLIMVVLLLVLLVYRGKKEKTPPS
jgi:hypothetical protein